MRFEMTALRPTDYIIVSPYGLGDTYILCALAEAFKRKHCRNGERFVISAKRSHFDLIKMFEAVDGFIEWDGMHSMPNHSLRPGVPFVAHPEYVPVRLDYTVAHGKMTDVAMYALILGLDPATPLSLPNIDDNSSKASLLFSTLGCVPDKTVMLFPDTSSWPIAVPTSFWDALSEGLRAEGWKVIFNNSNDIPLDCVISLVEKCGWVIGANSGIMQLLVAAQADCRKTIITSNIEGFPYPLPVRATFPYRLMRTVLGDQYDIEEFRWSPGKDESLVTHICHGRNAVGTAPRPAPVTYVEVTTTPGDVLDRISILRIKAEKLPHKAWALQRELQELLEIRQTLSMLNMLVFYEAKLLDLNRIAWDNNQILIDAYAGDFWTPEWGASDQAATAEQLDKTCMCAHAFGLAHRANQERVRIKNKINAICGCINYEVKSYE